MANVSSRIVEVCVFKIVPAKSLYLLLRRSQEERLYPGIWQIVTGKLKDRENTVQAALREVKEETGLHPFRLWIVPHIALSYSVDDDTVNLSPFFAMQVRESDEPTISSEHKEYNWYEREEAKSRLVWPSQKQGLQLVHEYVVGGLEAAKLTEITDLSYFERDSS